MDKITSLSQAIRLGSTFYPQCKNYYVNYENKVIKATCSLGAAGLAVNIDAGKIDLEAIEKRFPDIPRGILSSVISLNDFNDKSYEEIVIWLEKQGY